MAKDEKKIPSLTGPEKAAILLLTLGEEFTSEVFKELDDQEIKNLGQAMNKIHNVKPAHVQAVLWEFMEGLDIPADIRVKGRDFFKNAIGRALGEKRAEGLLDDLNAPLPFSGIKNIDSEALGDFIRNEHPQTIALVLAHIEPGKSARIISGLPLKLQQEVILRIADLKNVPVGILDELEGALLEEFKSRAPLEGQTAGGSDAVARILNEVDHKTENTILKRLEADRPELYDEVRKLMFAFEELLEVDDRAIRIILREINRNELALALKAATMDLRGKIFANLSGRAAAMLKEDIEAMGPTRLSDAEKAQQSILRIVKKLEGEGRINIGRGDEGERFV